MPHFRLKGALRFQLWNGQPHCPTHDADLLAFGPDDVPTSVGVFRAICSMVADDSIGFDPESVAGTEIRKDDAEMQHATEATLARRQTAMPGTQPIGLSGAFAEDATKQVQWRAFLKKNTLQAMDLAEVVRCVRERAWRSDPRSHRLVAPTPDVGLARKRAQASTSASPGPRSAFTDV